jgi:FKBP-type peptidyl-prolyl cis-trans isomerase 2
MDAGANEQVIERKGSFVRIRYRLRTDQGEYVRGDPREGDAILEFFTGYRQVLPSLEERLIGRSSGERLRFEIGPEDAFGQYREELIREKSFDEFPEGRSLEAGKWAVARDDRTRAAYGYYVREKKQDSIILDYNHPLAGKTLIYELVIEEVRPATHEERVILRPCEAGKGGEGQEEEAV